MGFTARGKRECKTAQQRGEHPTLSKRGGNFVITFFFSCAKTSLSHVSPVFGNCELPRISCPRGIAWRESLFCSPRSNENMLRMVAMTRKAFAIVAVAFVCGTRAAPPPVTFQSPFIPSTVSHLLCLA